MKSRTAKGYSTRSITPNEIEEIFGCKLNDDLRNYVLNLNLDYKALSDDETREVCLSCFEMLIGSDMKIAGKHRKDEWETGWEQNVKSFMQDPSTANLRPLYFGKFEVSRWRQQFIRPVSLSFEVDMLSVIVRWVAMTFMVDSEYIAEFGCGTGINLVDLRSVYPNSVITGLDWTSSSQELVSALANSTNDSKIFARKFDFFEPDTLFAIGPETAVLTVAALEQVGSNFGPFLEYLLSKQPKVCVHIEPIGELLDSQNTLDFISIEYFKKRKYLDGFLTELRRRAELGELVIHQQSRTFVGSMFIEGHSVVVWSPR
jgi:hypothetical protein